MSYYLNKQSMSYNYNSQIRRKIKNINRVIGLINQYNHNYPLYRIEDEYYLLTRTEYAQATHYRKHYDKASDHFSRILVDLEKNDNELYKKIETLFPYITRYANIKSRKEYKKLDKTGKSRFSWNFGSFIKMMAIITTIPILLVSIVCPVDLVLLLISAFIYWAGTLYS